MSADATHLEVQATLRRGRAVLVVSGELDLASAREFEAVVAGLVRVPGVARVDVDGRALRFVDSAGVHALLRSRTDAHALGVDWFVGPASPALTRILDLAAIGWLHDASMN